MSRQVTAAAARPQVGRRGLPLQTVEAVIRVGLPLGLLAVALALWQVVVVRSRVPDFVLPPPSEIWQTLLDEHDLLIQNAVPTLQVALLGFCLAVMAGVAVALLIHLFRVIELALYPIVIASQAVPVLALAPVLVIIFGYTLWPKLIVVALVCFFPITVNLVDGMRNADPDLIRVLRTLGAGRATVLWQVEIPSALPSLFSGARVAATFSVIGALYGEWVGSSEGLAFLIQQLQSKLDTAGLFAAMAVLTLIGIALFYAVSALEWICVPWNRGS